MCVAVSGPKCGDMPGESGEWGEREAWWVEGRKSAGPGHGTGTGFPWAAPQMCPLPSSIPCPPLAQPHLVLGQQLAPPVGVGDIVEGEAQVMVTVLKQQGLWLFH